MLKHILTAKNMHILFHEPTECRKDTKMEKGLFDEESNVAMWLYCSLEDSKTVFLVKK